MIKTNFKCDYAEGAHPLILEALARTNFEQLDGYGEDPYTRRAKEKILAACECPDGEVFFLVGGTQTNETVISALLKGYEGVVAAETGHIAVHESGAVEFTGHKVITLPQHLGKIDPTALRQYLDAFHADPNRDHMVWPGMVYLSFPTEYGTLYSRSELREIHATAQHFGIPVFVDGARLAYGLTSPSCDIQLHELKDFADVFYIGGTKVGALCGEAVVFPRKGPAHFLTSIKQHGALLAKGRLLGIQFDTLFTDSLYWKLGTQANEAAATLKDILKEKGIPFYLESPTNQQFVILENSRMQALAASIGFDIWQPYDETSTVVRFATSWATTPEALSRLREIL